MTDTQPQERRMLSRQARHDLQLVQEARSLQFPSDLIFLWVATDGENLNVHAPRDAYAAGGAAAARENAFFC